MFSHNIIDMSSYYYRCVLILQTALVVWRCSSLHHMLHQQRHTRLEQRVCVFVCVCVCVCTSTHTWGAICFFLFAFFNEALNAVLHLSEFSDQLDVTLERLESSKVVKLALIWVTRTQSDAIT